MQSLVGGRRSSMTSKSKTASAVVGLAAVVAGVSMAAFALRIQAEDRVWTETRKLTVSSPFEASAGARYVPPEPPRGDVDIGPITYEFRSLPVVQPAAQPGARPRLKQTCAPYWRKLVDGPAGRQVAITCPGGPQPPPPPPSTERVSGLQRLPSLEDLRNGPLPPHAIAGGTPNAEEALRAGRRVAESFAQRRVVRPESTPSAESRVPASNPLDWRACSPQERTASNELEAAGRC
jgi:hypothetical protein